MLYYYPIFIFIVFIFIVLFFLLFFLLGPRPNTPKQGPLGLFLFWPTARLDLAHQAREHKPNQRPKPNAAQAQHQTCLLACSSMLAQCLLPRRPNSQPPRCKPTSHGLPLSHEAQLPQVSSSSRDRALGHASSLCMQRPHQGHLSLHASGLPLPDCNQRSSPITPVPSFAPDTSL